MNGGEIHSLVNFTLLSATITVGDKGHRVLALELCAVGDANAVRDLVGLGSLQCKDAQPVRTPVDIRLATTRTRIGCTRKVIGEHVAWGETNGKHCCKVRRSRVFFHRTVVMPALILAR